MEKQLMIIGITFVLLIVGISGCTEQDSRENNNEGYLDSRFFGDWELADSEYGANISYSSDGRYYTTALGWIGTWEVKNGKICTTLDEQFDNYRSCIDFTFSNNNKTLTFNLEYQDKIYHKIE